MVTLVRLQASESRSVRIERACIRTHTQTVKDGQFSKGPFPFHGLKRRRLEAVLGKSTLLTGIGISIAMFVFAND